MSPLTKALVVLVTVLSVLELGMFVAYSSKHNQLNEQITKLRQDYAAATAATAVAEQELQAAQDKQTEQVAQLSSQNSSLQSQLTAAESAVKDANSQVQAEKARNDKTEQAIARLTAAAQQDAVLREALIDELKTVRSELVDLRTKTIQLSDANNELTSTRDSLDRRVRWYAEELSDANQKVEDYEKKLVAAGVTLTGTAGPKAPVPSKVPIEGKITQVDTSSSTPLVAVNVGANDGVAKGMEFIVHRGDTYLGKLVIENVDADQSAGRMVLVKAPVQANDAIYTGPY